MTTHNTPNRAFNHQKKETHTLGGRGYPQIRNIQAPFNKRRPKTPPFGYESM